MRCLICDGSKWEELETVTWFTLISQSDKYFCDKHRNNDDIKEYINKVVINYFFKENLELKIKQEDKMEPEIEMTMHEKKIKLLSEAVEDLKNVLENKPITKAQRIDLETILPIWEDILSDYTCDKQCACEDKG